MKNKKRHKLKHGGVKMPKKTKPTNKQKQAASGKNVGYGDKKLEGPDRPST